MAARPGCGSSRRAPRARKRTNPSGGPEAGEGRPAKACFHSERGMSRLALEISQSNDCPEVFGRANAN